jgi:hypothetical protein
MRLLTLLTAAILPLGVAVPAAATPVAAAPAAATPAIWKWRSVHSADGMARAWGKVAISQFGYVVYGNLEDTIGKGCAWAVLRAQSAGNGRWKTYGFYNCTPGTGTFRKNYGSVLQIKVQVCRGTSKRPTGECSKQKTIMTQGG